MCGRYTFTQKSPARYEEVLNAEFPEFQPRYNIAPGQENPVVHESRAGYTLDAMLWGLVPHWSKEPKTKYSTINAKVETVAEKPFYRDAFKSRRCLVPADGWYEWCRTEPGKQPYYIHMGPHAFAGVWDFWKREGAEPFNSYAIITGPAAEMIKHIHPRMPLVLAEAIWAEWLDPDRRPNRLSEILCAPLAAFETYAISTRAKQSQERRSRRNQTPVKDMKLELEIEYPHQKRVRNALKELQHGRSIQWDERRYGRAAGPWSLYSPSKQARKTCWQLNAG